MNYEQEIEVLKRQILSIRRELQEKDEWIDTVSSPPYKRIWWWFGGYKFCTVGRWYPENSTRFKIWSFFARLINCL